MQYIAYEFIFRSRALYGYATLHTKITIYLDIMSNKTNALSPIK